MNYENKTELLGEKYIGVGGLEVCRVKLRISPYLYDELVELEGDSEDNLINSFLYDHFEPSFVNDHKCATWRKVTQLDGFGREEYCDDDELNKSFCPYYDNTTFVIEVFLLGKKFQEKEVA